MKKIELTRNQVTLVDDIDYKYLMQWKWYANWYRNCFRAKRNLPQVNGKRKAIYMYTIIAERMGIDSKRIDHKDHNPLNNQRSNLRPATRSQNGHNHGANSNSKTGVKGVSFDRSRNRYRVRLRVEGKRYRLGRFDTIEEATIVIQRKREELVGEFACH